MLHPRRKLRDELNAEYKKKGISSIYDKRRILNDSLGHVPTLSSLKEDELKIVIEYVKAKSEEELKSKVIGWAYISSEADAFIKTPFKKLLESVPSNIQLTPFILDEGNVHAMVFLNSEYREDKEEIKELLFSFSQKNNNQDEDNRLVLSNGNQLQFISQLENVLSN